MNGSTKTSGRDWRTKRFNNRSIKGITGRTIAVAIAASSLIVGMGIGPASAATTPRHWATITCSTWSHVDVTGAMFGFTNKNEAVAWYPELQRWQGNPGSWVTVSAPNTGTWHYGAVNRSFAPQAESWSLHGLQVAPGYWYRVRSSFYWYENRYQTSWETTSPCLAKGIQITY